MLSSRVNGIEVQLRESRAELKGTRDDLGDLNGRMAHLDGLLEGLREAIVHARAA